jgi:hypothetical protein
MAKEFYKKGKNFNSEGWISFNLADFGLGFSFHSGRYCTNLQISFLFLEFYISVYESPSKKKL